MVLTEITYIPALIKIFSEILDNSIDESRRHPGSLDTIRVDINDDTISVYDNGRGIPVEIHPNMGKYVAEAIFSNLRAGSNFSDEEDQQLIGTHGIGSTATNILSSSFKVESCDGKKLLKQEFFNGMRERTEPKIKPHDKNYTRITFTPDYEFFKLPGLDTDHVNKIVKKVVDAAATNTNVKFYVNGNRIPTRSFEHYIEMYSDEYVYDENDSWKVGVSASDGFEQVSFVNSVETYQGGQHVTYVINQIVEALRDNIKRKHKVTVSPGDIRGHLRVYISANVNRPRFSSQTKENMISPVSEWKTSWSVPDKFVNKLLKSSIIQSILDWVAAKEQAALMAEARKLNKDSDKANLRKIEKFTDATEKDDRSKCMLFIVEGLSAASSVLSARDPKMIGVYPLKGKPINAMGADLKKLMDNQEFVDLLAIIGLKIGQKVKDVSELRFGKIVSCCDADHDGNHIFGLLTAMIKKFWPELLEMGVFHKFTTPIAKIQQGKAEKWFYSLEEYNEWIEANGSKQFKSRYLKGLGSSTAKDFAEYFKQMDKNLIQVGIDEKADMDVIDLVFGKEAGSSDARKVWLTLE